MKARLGLILALAATAMVPAHADAPKIGRNAKIFSADGAVLGNVDRVIMKGDVIDGVQLIVGSRMVVLPGNTISVDEAGVKTTLSKKQVRALR